MNHARRRVSQVVPWRCTTPSGACWAARTWWLREGRCGPQRTSSATSQGSYVSPSPQTPCSRRPPFTYASTTQVTPTPSLPLQTVLLNVDSTCPIHFLEQNVQHYVIILEFLVNTDKFKHYIPSAGPDTAGHPWHVHERAAKRGNDCTFVGGHFDPFAISLGDR